MAKTIEKELIEEYISLLNITNRNADEIKMREQRVPEEYTNTKVYLFSVLLLLRVPFLEKGTNIVIEYNNKIFREKKDDIIDVIGEERFNSLKEPEKNEPEIPLEPSVVDEQYDLWYEHITMKDDPGNLFKPFDMFIFNKFQIKKYDRDGFLHNISVMVFPLEYQPEKRPTRILVITTDMNHVLYFCSGDKISVEADLEIMQITVFGKWENGSFITNVCSADTEEVIEEKLNVEKQVSYPKYFGLHIRIDDLDAELFPTDLKNNPNTGTVAAIAAIKNGDDITLIPTNHEGIVLIPVQDKVYSFCPYWMGDGLHVFF